MRHCPFRPFDFEFPRGPHSNCGDRNCPGNAQNHPIMPHFDDKNHPNFMPFDQGLMKSMDHIMDELLKPMCTTRKHEQSGPHAIHRSHNEPHLSHHGSQLAHLSHDPTWTRLSPLALVEDKHDHVFVSDHKYQIKCRTEGYTPEELTVRTLNNLIMVEGRHEENTSNSQNSRYFFKKWAAPDGVIVDRVVCHVNTKYGYMQIDAPRVSHGDRWDLGGKLVPIKVTSPFGSPNKIGSPFGSPPQMKISSPHGSPPRKVHFDEVDKKHELRPEVDKIVMV